MAQTQQLNFDQASGRHGQRNADWAASLTFTSGGSPVDLTGYTMKLTIRPFANATPVVTIQTSDATWQGIKIPTPTNGQVALQIAKTALATCPAPANPGDTYSCIYDLLVTDAGGHTYCWFYGTFDIANGVG